MGCCSAGPNVASGGRIQICQTRVNASGASTGVIHASSTTTAHGHSTASADNTEQPDSLATCLDEILKRVEGCRVAFASRIPDFTLEEITAGMDVFSGYGVALATFGPSQVWSIWLPLLPLGKLKDALQKWGPTENKMERVDGGFKSTVKISHLPPGSSRHEWCSEVCASQEVAQSSAYALALMALSIKPEVEFPYVFQEIIDPETHFINVAEGDELTLLVRDRGGWAYCRQIISGCAGWLPASHVVELATVQADHDAEGVQGMLSVVQGDVLEVVHRHYSGWSFCREWLGIGGMSSAGSSRKGWVAETFLEDQLADQERRETKFLALIDQALGRVAVAAQELKVVAGSPNGNSDYLMCEWMAGGLTDELKQIENTLATHLGRKLEKGSYAYVSQDVNSLSSASLTLATGDHVLILHLETSGWAWCQVPEVGQEGWVPLQSLSPHEPTEDPPGALPAVCSLPTCAICLEPLHVNENQLALPCAHTFHLVCVGMWLSEKSQCPLCRTPADTPRRMRVARTSGRLVQSRNSPEATTLHPRHSHRQRSDDGLNLMALTPHVSR